jgi:hypothetical protein
MSRCFLITIGYPHETLPSPFEVKGASVEAAADIAWRMLHAHYLPAEAWLACAVVRVTGRLGERGWFQLYRHMPDEQHPGRAVRFDSAFHVQPREGASDPGSFAEAQREFAAPRAGDNDRLPPRTPQGRDHPSSTTTRSTDP